MMPTSAAAQDRKQGEPMYPPRSTARAILRTARRAVMLVGAVGSVAVMPCLAVADDDLRIVIVRHGEKAKNGDNLSCQGENRALALPAVLTGRFGTPDFTYVPALGQGDATKHARMFQTVTPFAVKANLTIDSGFEEGDTAGVAKDVLTRRGLVLMVWEHSQIQKLARSLGVPNPPKWKDEDFDSIWVITPSGTSAVMSVAGAGLAPSPTCSF